MMTIRIALICTLFFLSFSSFAQQPPYKNPSLPIKTRVADLLARMTLAEKTAQLQSGHMGRPKLSDAVLNNPAKMDSLFKNGAGMMNPAFDETLEQTHHRRNAL